MLFRSPIKDIKNSVNTLVDDVRGLKARLDEGNEFARDLIKNKISAATEDIVAKSGKLVSGMIDSSFNQLVPIGQGGLQNLYSGVYGKILAATKSPPIAHIAGVAAQTAMLAPLNVAENLIGCLANNIISDLGSNVEDILNSTVDNVLNFSLAILATLLKDRETCLLDKYKDNTVVYSSDISMVDFKLSIDDRNRLFDEVYELTNNFIERLKEKESEIDNEHSNEEGTTDKENSDNES